MFCLDSIDELAIALYSDSENSMSATNRILDSMRNPELGQMYEIVDELLLLAKKRYLYGDKDSALDIVNSVLNIVEYIAK